MRSKVRDYVRREIFKRAPRGLWTKKGVSARDTSLSIGQSPNWINKIESWKSYPSMTVFYCICECLGVTQVEFFDAESGNPARLNELVAMLFSLKTRYVRAREALEKPTAFSRKNPSISAFNGQG
jgi:transcriptional regulator with XRE-family HTH domain